MRKFISLASALKKAVAAEIKLHVRGKKRPEKPLAYEG